MGKGIATINYAECMACGCCVQACPFSFLDLMKTDVDVYHKNYPQLVPDHKCTGCGLCATACPVDCVTIQ
ncbi:MAG TPA: 4Fe-4S binding protein [Longilinea sp.]|nr:4Fe-4S binding protein [Longilinea sp.]